MVSSPSSSPSPSRPSSSTSPSSSPPGHLTHGRAVVLALVVTVLWSSSWVLIRRGLDDEDLPPITFAGLRYGCAALVLWGWVLTSRRRAAVRRLSRRQIGALVLLGVVFYAVTQGAQFVAIDRQPAATTSLVLSLTPLLTALVGGRTLGEPPSMRQVGGSVLVAAGAWSYFAGDLGATTIGMLAALVGLTANVASGLLGRGINRSAALPAVVVTVVSMTIGAAVLVVAGLAVEGWPAPSGRAFLIIAWLAVVNTALAFTMWNASLVRLSAIESAAINNLMLIQIAALAWIFLDEPPGQLGVVGIVAVSVGVFLTQTGGLTRRPG